MHSEGDYLGQPFRLRKWQREIIYRAYELDDRGHRRYDRVLLGLPKGNGKTELGAAISCAELAGPVIFNGWDNGKPRGRQRTAPDIPVGAASFEQANTLFGSAKTMIQKGPLEPLFECFETKVMPKHEPGILYRVAAIAGPNDGRRPTFFVADELHEWEGSKERVHLVLSNGRAKRADAWELSISTAGRDSPDLLLRRLYDVGKQHADPKFLFIWFEADRTHDLESRRGLRKAVRQASPAAGDFLSIENILQRYNEIAEHEFRRYYLNQWESGPEKWLPPELWSPCVDNRVVQPGTSITVGFDGAYARDSTALVGCTLDGHLFVLDCWERPQSSKDWRVDMAAVEQRIRDVCSEFRVLALGMDPFFWRQQIEMLEKDGLPAFEWPSHTPSRMAPACKQFEDAVRDGQLTHDGDQRLAIHVANCEAKEDRFGRRIVKDHKDSARHIDLAVAGVIAYDLFLRRMEIEPTRWVPL